MSRFVCRDRHDGRARRPHTHIGDDRLIVEKPAALDDLWAWAVEEADTARKAPPLQIHQREYPPIRYDKDGRPIDTHPGRWVSRGRPTVIGGLPFSRAFEAYLSTHSDWTPARMALRILAERGRRDLGYRIANAVIEDGYISQEDLRAVIGCNRDTFTAAAIEGLGILWDETVAQVEAEMRKHAPALTPAGSAVS